MCGKGRPNAAIGSGTAGLKTLSHLLDPALGQALLRRPKTIASDRLLSGCRAPLGVPAMGVETLHGTTFQIGIFHRRVCSFTDMSVAGSPIVYLN